MQSKQQVVSGKVIKGGPGIRLVAGCVADFESNDSQTMHGSKIKHKQANTQQNHRQVVLTRVWTSDGWQRAEQRVLPVATAKTSWMERVLCSKESDDKN